MRDILTALFLITIFNPVDIQLAFVAKYGFIT